VLVEQLKVPEDPAEEEFLVEVWAVNKEVLEPALAKTSAFTWALPPHCSHTHKDSSSRRLVLASSP
jgi:hypothetical protein